MWVIADLVAAIDDAEDALIGPDGGAVEQTGVGFSGAGVRAEIDKVGAVNLTSVGALTVKRSKSVVGRLVEIHRVANLRGSGEAVGGDVVGEYFDLIVPLDES